MALRLGRNTRGTRAAAAASGPTPAAAEAMKAVTVPAAAQSPMNVKFAEFGPTGNGQARAKIAARVGETCPEGAEGSGRELRPMQPHGRDDDARDAGGGPQPLLNGDALERDGG